MTAAAVLLLLAVDASNPYLAVAALALCFMAVELTEGSFWAGGMTVGRGDSMAVCGFMNTGGNLGGIIGIPDRRAIFPVCTPGTRPSSSAQASRS